MRGLRRCAGVLTVLLAICSRAAFAAEPAPIPSFDMGQVQGKTWYLARYIPARFFGSVPPEDCTSNSTAQFVSSAKAGYYDMKLVCQKAGGGSKTLTKEIRRTSDARAGAFEINPSVLAPWRPFYILEAELTGPNPYFVMGGPSKKMLLIFASTPSLPAAVEQGIVARMKGMGYTTDNLLPKLATP